MRCFFNLPISLLLGGLGRHCKPREGLVSTSRAVCKSIFVLLLLFYPRPIQEYWYWLTPPSHISITKDSLLRRSIYARRFISTHQPLKSQNSSENKPVASQQNNNTASETTQPCCETVKPWSQHPSPRRPRTTRARRAKKKVSNLQNGVPSKSSPEESGRLIS